MKEEKRRRRRVVLHRIELLSVEQRFGGMDGLKRGSNGVVCFDLCFLIGRRKVKWLILKGV